MSRTVGACLLVCVAVAFLGAVRAIGDKGTVTVTFSADKTEAVRHDSTLTKRYIGHVVARTNPEVWLKAHEATYDGENHVISLTGLPDEPVTVVDSGRTLHAARATYFLKEHHMAGGSPLMVLRGRVFVEDSTRSITAREVKYRPEPDSIEAIGRVHARQPGGYLLADTLWFDAKHRGMTATGAVSIFDSTQDVTIRSGWYAYRPKDSVGVVARSPVLVKGRGDTAVSVSSDSMRFEQPTRSAVAWGDVRVVRGGLDATCDSVVYDDKASELRLYGSPEATQTTVSDTGKTVSTLHGDRIVLTLDGSNVTKIAISGSARGVATESDSTGKETGERWIAGRQIVFHVDHERVTGIDVFGEAMSRYMPADRPAEGVNEASGDTIRIAFAGGRMSRVALSGGVQGMYWPPPESTRVAQAPSKPERRKP